jgi:TonB family protein
MYYVPAQKDRALTDYMVFGLLISLIAHVAIALILTHTKSPLPQSAITVELVADPEQRTPALQQPRQIVTTPDNHEETETPLENTRLLAEKNFAAKQEKIRHGDAPNAEPNARKSLAAKQASPERRESKPQKQEAPTKLKQLSLDRDTLLNEFSLPAHPDSKQAESENSSSTLARREYQAFSRPAGSGAAFLGMNGIPDYLPNLPDGDITMLNTKANLFAVFVRRVATQVFAQLRSNGWESLRAGDIQQIGSFVTVRAILSPAGKLLKVELLEPSGSPKFDETVRRAAELGARDPNPPKAAAAEDGNIHFIFQSKSWSRFGASRNGAPSERRWLLLGTGLE